MGNRNLPDIRMKHSSLVLVGWSVLAVVAWTLLVPRTVFSIYPGLADVTLGVAMTTALHTIIEMSCCAAKAWQPVQGRSARISRFLKLGRPTLFLVAVLVLALSRIANR